MRISRREFGRLVAQAVAELPQEIHDVLDNVNIVVQDWPSPQQLELGDPDDPHSLLGLYEGIPQIARGHYNFALPDRITLFRRPLAEVCRSSEKLLEEVRTTVVHEIAHHLGWSDDDLEYLGYA